MIYCLKIKGQKTGPVPIKVCYCFVARIIGDLNFIHKNFTDPDINNIHGICDRLIKLHPTEQVWVEEV